MYNLFGTGLEDAMHRRLFRRRRIARDYLGGLLDGINTYFNTHYYPIQSSGSVSVYVAGGDLLAVASVDYETGELELVNAPESQPMADYYVLSATEQEIKDTLFEGFRFMEWQWRRGLKLSSGSETWQEAKASSPDAFIVTVSDSQVSDPANQVSFSASHTQIGFLVECVRFVHLLNIMEEAAVDDFDYREDRGITVRKLGRTANLERVVSRQERMVARALDAAAIEWYGTSAYGGYIQSPATADYMAFYEWQEQSKALGYRQTRWWI